MTRASLLACLLGAALLAACEMPFGVRSEGPSSSPSPSDRLTIEPGLEVTLLAPDTVAAADSFEVRTTVKNKTGQTVELQTPTSCLFEPGVYFDGERVQMKGSLLFCAMVITDRTISPGDGRAHTYEMQAVLTDSEEETLTPPGKYTIQVGIDWVIKGRRVEKALEVPLTIVQAE